MGKRIEALRKKKGLSRAELADRADVSREYVRKLEAGLYDPTVGTLERLAKALGVQVTELLGGPSMNVERLKHTLSDDLEALRAGKGILGIDEMAAAVEKLGTGFRFLAQNIRSSKADQVKLAAEYAKVLEKLERTP